MLSNDKLITAISKDGKIHGYVLLIRDTARIIQEKHKMNIISSSIFLRALAGGALLSGSLKNRDDRLILTWSCTGPVKKIVVDVNYQGEIRGYIEEPNLQFIEGSLVDGSIVAEPYIGFGEFNLSRISAGIGIPYHSVTAIETGEIAQDLSIYLNQSLQIESCINIGLSISEKNEIEVCGGALLMALPGASDEEKKIIGDKFNEISSLTGLLKDNEENTFDILLNKFDLDFVSEKEIKFNCSCTDEIIRKLINSLNEKEKNEYRLADNKISVVCQYCNKEYLFDD
ncbi:MAG TPA: Hsp33 family molecular chaperone HslO [Spirochaetota bacterium]|jgi:molecular chaperone Hsp33|nr:MAG: 33 kDa chaperonin [Spirochaetes bacterium ADurb.Bin133]HPY88644.1 Hsp33 family molecular chaperone HslO [Spirochaetota bacterium]